MRPQKGKIFQMKRGKMIKKDHIGKYRKIILSIMKKKWKMTRVYK